MGRSDIVEILDDLVRYCRAVRDRDDSICDVVVIGWYGEDREGEVIRGMHHVYVFVGEEHFPPSIEIEFVNNYPAGEMLFTARQRFVDGEWKYRITDYAKRIGIDVVAILRDARERLIEELCRL